MKPLIFVLYDNNYLLFITMNYVFMNYVFMNYVFMNHVYVSRRVSRDWRSAVPCM